MGRPQFGRPRGGGSKRGPPPRKRKALSRLREVVEDVPEHYSDKESDSEQSDLEEPNDAAADPTESQSSRPFDAYQLLLKSLQKDVDDTAARTRQEIKTNEKKRRRQQQSDEPAAPIDDLADDNDEDEAEDEEAALEEADVSVDSDDDESNDPAVSAIPFNAHISPDPTEAKNAIDAVKDGQYTDQIDASVAGGKFISYFPSHPSFKLPTKTNNRPESLGMKSRLAELAKPILEKASAHDAEISNHIFGYRDLLYANRTVENAEQLRKITTLHFLNHIFRTRDRVLRNSAKLSRNLELVSSDEIRDQGFARPKVLLLMETCSNCAKWVDTITALSDPEQQENKKRFTDMFVHPTGKFPTSKPADFLELFDGNDDNDFRIGIKFTRKTIKFFSQFYQSDIIIASPLGLRKAIEGSKTSRKQDCDFLSSIEIVVIDQADALVMQNWDHVESVLGFINRQPRQSHGCDFSRVRPWYLDEQSAYYRQTIALSAYLSPELNGSIFNSRMKNYAGKVKYKPVYAGLVDSVAVGLGFRQSFSRFSSASPWDDPDDRFEYFKSTVLPWIGRLSRASTQASPLGLVIFAPAYADWLRISNLFSVGTDPITRTISNGSVSEYTDSGTRQSIFARFSNARLSVLIYSGRAHHFFRPASTAIGGVRRMVMYGIPDNPTFYSELTEGLIGRTIGQDGSGADLAGSCSVNVLYSKWDVLRLERVVGTDRVRDMIRETGPKSFEFV